MKYIAAFNGWVDSVFAGCWNWFAGLHPQEWIVVLGIGAVVGFICVCGIGRKYRV